MGDPFEATKSSEQSSLLLNGVVFPGIEIVDFWAPWCGPCKAMSPILDKVVEKYKGWVKVTKINTDEHPDLAKKYNVRSIPYMLYYYNGYPCRDKTGTETFASISNYLENKLYEKSGAKFFNGGVECDVWRGHCACGAAHGEEDRPSLGFYSK